jgi:transcriptional regulator with XRE-family HTH domain
VALSRTSVTNIEKGRQKMMLHTLWQFASALGVDPTVLLPDEQRDSHAGQTRAERTDEGRAVPSPRASKRVSGRGVLRAV